MVFRITWCTGEVEKREATSIEVLAKTLAAQGYVIESTTKKVVMFSVPGCVSNRAEVL